MESARGRFICLLYILEQLCQGWGVFDKCVCRWGSIHYCSRSRVYLLLALCEAQHHWKNFSAPAIAAFKKKLTIGRWSIYFWKVNWFQNQQKNYDKNIFKAFPHRVVRMKTAYAPGGLLNSSERGNYKHNKSKERRNAHSGDCISQPVAEPFHFSLFLFWHKFASLQGGT